MIVLQQVPVRLAYALTIHKCQGMTLSKAELSLGSAFEYGEFCEIRPYFSYHIPPASRAHHITLATQMPRYDTYRLARPSLQDLT